MAQSAVTFARTPRLPVNGWVRKQTPDTPAFFVKIENDIETDQIVTEEELRLFYKKYGVLLRGVKQRKQIEFVAAAKAAGPGQEFTGYAGDTPIFRSVPVLDTTTPGDATTLEGASGAAAFVPSAR